MRSLRLFRSNSNRIAEQVEASADAGLLSFAPEVPPETVDPPVAQGLATRWRLALGLLLTLVLLQAVPTILWVKGRFGGAGLPAAAAPAPIAPPSIVPAAACEPAPAPTQPAPAAPPARAAVTAPAPPPAMVAGLVAISAPLPMHVYLKGKLVGTTESETIMLPAGTHELELRNDLVGYRARRSISVQAGRTISTRLEVPSGTVHVNAVPWADVSIDNQRVGETPIGNLALTLGTHEVVFRHPELGERRTTVLVTLKEPARVSMDLRKK